MYEKRILDFLQNAPLEKEEWSEWVEQLLNKILMDLLVEKMEEQAQEVKTKLENMGVYTKVYSVDTQYDDDEVTLNVTFGGNPTMVKALTKFGLKEMGV